MAAHSSTHRKWRRTRAREPPSFTTAPRNGSLRTRSSEFASNVLLGKRARHGERCFPRSETHGDCCPQRRLAVVSVTPVAGCMCSAARNSIRTCCQAECCCRSECADEVCQVERRLLVYRPCRQ